jgi:hypothetical protein
VLKGLRTATRAGTTLPSSFLGETLTESRLTSTGGVGISDASIRGLAVLSAVPEPTSLSLLAVGAFGLAGLIWRGRPHIN